MNKQAAELQEIADEMNPEFIFQGTPDQLLVDLASGKIDVAELVRREMANRGLDQNGVWVGFAKAAQIHGVSFVKAARS